MTSLPSSKTQSKSKRVTRGVMGRPSLYDDARTISYHVKVTKNEYDLWKKLAQEKGLSLSSFMLEPIREAFPGNKADHNLKVKERK